MKRALILFLTSLLLFQIGPTSSAKENNEILKLKELFREGQFNVLEMEAKRLLNTSLPSSEWYDVSEYLSKALHAQCRFRECLEVYNEIIERKKPDSLLYRNVEGYIDMADLFLSIGNLVGAEEAIARAEQEALNMHKCTHRNQMESLLILYLTKSKLATKKGDTRKAIEEWKSAQCYLPGTDQDLLWLGLGGTVHEEAGDSVTADSLFMEGLKREERNPNSLVCLIHCVNFRNKRGRFEEAKGLLERFSGIADYSVSPHLRRYYLLACGEMLQGLGRESEAASMFHNAYILGDSLNNLDKELMNREWATKIDPTDYSVLSKRMDRLYHKESVYVLIFSMSSALALIISWISSGRLRERRREYHKDLYHSRWTDLEKAGRIKLLNDRLNESEMDLTNSSLAISRMKTGIEDIMKEMQNPEKTHREKMMVIKRKVREVNRDNGSADFNLRLLQINQEFVQKLTSLNPSLTKSEILMACYVVAGMDCKEIARTTNRSTRTVETIRYTLRKKLGIEGSTEMFLRGLANGEE